MIHSGLFLWWCKRWKEQYFVNVGTDCGLTIARFYYVCFSCSDGSISARFLL
ncbi:putative vacuolar import/degradation protein Vid24 [Arabidopsis thaliana]